MARDSQPPPPQLISELHDRLDALQAEYDDYRKDVELSTQAAIDSALADLQSELNTVCADLAVAKSELREASECIKEREDEIGCLQGELEQALSEMVELKSKLQISGFNNAEDKCTDGMNIISDMKKRIISLEDHLSTFNISNKTL